MGGGNRRVFRVSKSEQRRAVVRRIKYHHRLLVVALYLDDRLYRRGNFKQRKNHEEKQKEKITQ